MSTPTRDDSFRRLLRIYDECPVKQFDRAFIRELLALTYSWGKWEGETEKLLDRTDVRTASLELTAQLNKVLTTFVTHKLKLHDTSE